MRREATMRALALALLLGSGAACQGEARCGPAIAEVRRVLDGDTVELDDGELVRYLMIDAPELSGPAECFGAEAAQRNAELVRGRQIELRYDVECRDAYGRLLAYVTARGHEVNRALIEDGYACVLQVPPNGAARLGELDAVERDARAHQRGLWGACSPRPCR